MRASHRSACSVTEQEVLAREKKSVAFTVTFVPHVHTCVCMSVCRQSLSVDSSSRGRVISATTEDFSRKQHAEHPVSCPLIAEVSGSTDVERSACVQSGLTLVPTCLETFIFRSKAVGVATAAAIPEPRACTDVCVKEPGCGVFLTLVADISGQLTPG